MFTFSEENSSHTKVHIRYKIVENVFEVKCLMIGRDLDKLLHTRRSCYLQYTNHCVIACDYVDATLSRNATLCF